MPVVSRYTDWAKSGFLASVSLNSANVHIEHVLNHESKGKFVRVVYQAL
jgi:hypothetical protein